MLAEIFCSGEIPPAMAESIDLCVSDEKLLNRAMTAKNGGRFRRLWAGETSDHSDDHSRADLARMLSFWCKGELERVDRLSRQSGLMRDKWDRPCGIMRYEEKTISALSSRAD